MLESAGLSLIPNVPASLTSVRKLKLSDLAGSLRSGWEDFAAYPSHAVMLAIIYPIVGLLIARVLHGYSFLPLLFPFTAGFALLGPFVAILFYDISRQRERGAAASVAGVRDILRSPSSGAIVALGAMLAVLFVIWVATAQSIYNATFGFTPVFSMPRFLQNVTGTVEGQKFLLEWFATGTGFAVVAYSISVISFPFLIDRNGSAADAILASLRAIARNPLVMALWGSIVAGLLVLASIPAFLGLAVVVPVLGHATWHLYRRVAG
jgi:uncharacterized membrane protein